MFQKKLFKKLCILLFVIAVFYSIDEALYLSWNYWWFDKLMHFAGGFSVSMAFIVFYSYFSFNLKDKKRVLVYCLTSVFFIGVMWEYFELYSGITSLQDGYSYIRDTQFDLIMDMIGGFFGLLYSLNFLKSNAR